MSNPDDLALNPQALPAAPEDPAEQLQWLVDRAMISEILTRLLTRIDSRDYRGVAELFTDDGVVVLPFASYPVDELPEISEQLFAPFEATHHMIGNVAITIDRDRAHSRQYLLASHIPRRTNRHCMPTSAAGTTTSTAGRRPAGGSPATH